MSKVDNTQKKPEKSKSSLIDIEGAFRFDTTTCFCCKKQIILYMELTKTAFILYTDESKSKVFLSIPRESIIAINKRQIDRYDVFKFSLHYKTNKTNVMKELKLRTRSRSDTDYWICTLRKIIQPKPYQFEYDAVHEEKASLLFKYGDIKKFYIALCHLEYILHKEGMRDFFRAYDCKRKLNDGTHNKTKEDSNQKEKDNDEDAQSDIFNDADQSNTELKDIHIEKSAENKNESSEVAHINSKENNIANDKAETKAVNENDITIEIK